VPWSSDGWRRPGPTEVLIAFGVFLLAATAVYLPHSFSHGFYTDDWWFLQRFHFIDASHGSFADMLDVSNFPGNYQDSFSLFGSYRPGQTVMLALQYLVAGDSATAHLMLAPPLVAIECLLLYLVLRMVGLRRPIAGAAGLLLAIGTFVDSTRLWSSVQPEMNAASLYLGGLACALTGLRSAGRRQIAWHGAAFALYLAAVFTYEGFLILLPITALAYLVVAERSAVLPRWLADLSAFAIGLATVARTANSDRGGEFSIPHLWHRAEDVVPAAVRVFRFSLPGGDLFTTWAGVLIALGVALGVFLAIKRGGPLARAARQWCVIGLAGLALAFIGITPLFAGQTGLTPANTGFGNRLIVVSSLFYPLLYLAAIVLAAIGLIALVKRPSLAVPVVVVGFGLTVAQFVDRELQRQDDFSAAWSEQNRILSKIQQAMPEPAPGSTIISFRHPVEMGGGLASFATDYDLEGALELRYRDRTIRAHPFLATGRCEPGGITFSGLFEAPTTLGYGRLYFVDTARLQVMRIETQAQCAREVQRLRSLPAKV
jgi:hypothetical protein